MDEDALVNGLRSGRLPGMGFDVFVEEPLPPNNPRWGGMENVMITPNSSVFTPRVQQVHKQDLKENLRRFLAEEPLLFVRDLSPNPPREGVWLAS